MTKSRMEKNAGGHHPDYKKSLPQEVSSLRNPKILKLRKYLSRPERARKEGVIIVEGRHPTEEAQAAGLELRLIISSSHIDNIKNALHLLSTLRYATKSHLHVADNVMEILSSDPSPQGLITVWDRPKFATFPPKPATSGSLIPALAQIQDPTNVGSLIRSAAAFGADGILVLEGTADPFHPKVIRASAGTVLRFPVWELPEEFSQARALKELTRSGWRLTALTPKGSKDLLPSRFGPPHARVLFLGSEGHGLPEELLESCREKFKIPIASTVESLGVAAAGAVAIYTLKKGATPPRSSSQRASSSQRTKKGERR